MYVIICSPKANWYYSYQLSTSHSSVVREKSSKDRSEGGGFRVRRTRTAVGRSNKKVELREEKGQIWSRGERRGWQRNAEDDQ